MLAALLLLVACGVASSAAAAAGSGGSAGGGSRATGAAVSDLAASAAAALGTQEPRPHHSLLGKTLPPDVLTEQDGGQGFVAVQLPEAQIGGEESAEEEPASTADEEALEPTGWDPADADASAPDGGEDASSTSSAECPQPAGGAPAGGGEGEPVRRLRRQARGLAQKGDWTGAADAYEEACALLSADADGPAVAAVLQTCRLNRALCCVKAERWDDAVGVCSETLQADPGCGMALFRRGQALLAQGREKAAAWDLQKSSKLLPANKEVARALKKARRAVKASSTATLLEPAGGGGGGGMDALMQQMLSDAGGAGGTGAPDLASLLGGLGEGLGGGGAADDGGLGGLLGALGGGGGGAGGGGAGGIEALLGSLGPKGGALGYVGKALAVKRHVDSAWAVVKRWTPLLFLGVLLLLWFKPLAELVTALLGK